MKNYYPIHTKLISPMKLAKLPPPDCTKSKQQKTNQHKKNQTTPQQNPKTQQSNSKPVIP